MQITSIWIAIGGNVDGAWGAPRDTFNQTLLGLEEAGFQISARSGLFRTPPFGRTGQPDFLNAVFAINGSVSPAALLRLLKRFEAKAGRRPNGRWGPRPLDLDILDFGGRVIGRAVGGRSRGGLVLPHPEMAHRDFVLTPLAEVAPHWHHPRLGVGAETLLKRNGRRAHGIRRLGDWDRS